MSSRVRSEVGLRDKSKLQFMSQLIAFHWLKTVSTNTDSTFFRISDVAYTFPT